MAKMLDKIVNIRWRTTDNTHLTYEIELPEMMKLQTHNFNIMRAVVMPTLKWQARVLEAQRGDAYIRLTRQGCNARYLTNQDVAFQARPVMFDIRHDLLINPQTKRERALTDDNVAFLFGCGTVVTENGQQKFVPELERTWDICEGFKPYKWMTLMTFMTPADIELADQLGFLY